ncbi:hypothetical protein SLOPH_844 [Spraguea lophii 42_110]|uniref:Uncharacterized protein n=1 Tax=Spraguea lophii (strain 42_110) TaxID=1358809 RepID=S7XJN5_SPRLO|nr:hypothetical protein SLOPH_844 [Spraguea lophii 42_110]
MNILKFGIYFTVITMLSMFTQIIQAHALLKNKTISPEELQLILFRIYEICICEVSTMYAVWRSIIDSNNEFIEFCAIIEIIIIITLVYKFVDSLLFVWIDIPIQLSKLLLFFCLDPDFFQNILWFRSKNLGTSEDISSVFDARYRYNSIRNAFNVINYIIFIYISLPNHLEWLVPIFVMIIIESFFRSCENLENLTIRRFQFVYSQAVFALALFLLIHKRLSTLSDDIYMQSIYPEEILYGVLDLFYLYFMYRDTQNYGRGLKEMFEKQEKMVNLKPLE